VASLGWRGGGGLEPNSVRKKLFTGEDGLMEQNLFLFYKILTDTCCYAYV
jgi:hypothetical protein